jgi:anthranilate phosphoribosyltransferase
VAILEGRGGARRDVVLLNAGAAFVAAGRVASLPQGIALAAETIDDGRARQLLERLRASKAAADAARSEAEGGAA